MKKGYSKFTKNDCTLKGEGDRKERRGNKDFCNDTITAKYL